MGVTEALSAHPIPQQDILSLAFGAHGESDMILLLDIRSTWVEFQPFLYMDVPI